MKTLLEQVYTRMRSPRGGVMTRRLSILLVAVFLASFMLSAGAVFSAGKPVIEIPITRIDPGQTALVPITVDTQGVGIRGYGVNLDFDPSKIQVNSVSDAGFLGDCPGGMVYVGNVVIDNAAGTLRGASATYLGCPTKTVSTAAGSPATIANISVTVKPGAANGKMDWVFAPNTKLIDASAGNMLPPAITLSPKWVQIGPLTLGTRIFLPFIQRP
jgi:hypothetical protein